MESSPWRVAYASIIGTAHVNAGTPCQDASQCQVMQSTEGSEVLLAVAADGAGSALRSQEGAQLTTESFLREFGLAIEENSSIDRVFVLQWLESLRKQIADKADAEGARPKDFACTVLGAVIAPQEAIFFQVGDGAIVVSGAEVGDYSWVFWPQHGEFANQTNFVIQENLSEVLDFEIVAGPINELAIFTDGIERLVLDFAAKTVHGPALQPIFEWLSKTNSGGRDPCNALAAYLGSEQINRRTDDDKTLVMATRTRFLAEKSA